MTFPLVVSDLVGTVAASVSGFTAGEPVWCNSFGHGGRQGAAAELAADRLYRLPAGVDPVGAVAVVHPGATEYLALFTHGSLRRDARVLVVVGGGNVGGAAVATAAHRATVYATARTAGRSARPRCSTTGIRHGRIVVLAGGRAGRWCRWARCT